MLKFTVFAVNASLPDLVENMAKSLFFAYLSSQQNVLTGFHLLHKAARDFKQIVNGFCANLR